MMQGLQRAGIIGIERCKSSDLIGRNLYRFDQDHPVHGFAAGRRQGSAVANVVELVGKQIADGKMRVGDFYFLPRFFWCKFQNSL